MHEDIAHLRLGIIADPQYDDRDPDPAQGRYFRQSLAKLEEAVAHFNTQSLDAVVVLGDLIDRGFENLAPVLARLDALNAPRILLPGNHDFIVRPDLLMGVYDALDMPAPYHHRRIKGLRLIVIDGNEISVFAPPVGDARRGQAERRLSEMQASGAANAQAWNAGMSIEQKDWLRRQLDEADKAGEPVIILGHYPLHPFTDHCLWDAEEIAALLASSPAALAYLCGHDHRGNCAERGGVHFINACGMVDTESDNAFAVLTVYSDRIEIVGHGREPSRSLSLSPEKRRRTAGLLTVS